MKHDATQNTTGNGNNVIQQHAGASYAKVRDQRKQPVRGLWERNGSFYAQMTMPHPATGLPAVRRVRLEDKNGVPVDTVPQAIATMNKMKAQRADETLMVAAKRTPTLSEYGQTYIERLEQLGNKRPNTVALERTMLNSLTASLGNLRLRELSPLRIHNHMAARIKSGTSPRTVNIEVSTLRNVLRSAIDDHLLNAIPPIKRLRPTTAKRRCLTSEEIDHIAKAALESSRRTGQMVHDFIMLMAYSGGRRSETLRLSWSDVDFEQKQLHIGSDGLSKNGEARSVDFNSQLEKHLLCMATRRAPDSDCLFPSPLRNKSDTLHVISFNHTIREARVRAKVPDFTPHMCRHYFASMALMSKVDVHTVASWLGHRDNGVLLSKTYSHLLNDHKREQAQLVSFGNVAPQSAP